MAFLVRQISHSAEGREIVRESRIDDDLLRVGRDPEADIRLTDLAVALRHVVIERISAGQLGVSGAEGLKFDLNGSSTNFGKIDLATGGEIRIASHLLRIMPTAAGAKDVEMVLERVSEPDEKIDPSVEEKFSLGSVLPGKRTQAWVFAVLVLGLFLAWPISAFMNRQQVQPAAAGAQAQPGAATSAQLQRAAAQEGFHSDETWSSGPLSQSHAFLEGNCTACHAKAFESVRDSSCKTCHTTIHDHADPVRMARANPDLSTWGKFQLVVKDTFGLPPGRCVECHTEHEGPTVMPVTQQKFCSDCHTDLEAKLPDTKLGNAGDFGRKHPEFQPAVIASWNGDHPVVRREFLAANPKPKDISNLKFPHDLHLSKTNGVAQMARRLSGSYGFENALQCKDCHDTTPDGVRFQPVNMEEDCAMCHSLAFDTQGGTVRTLRHGDPKQVIGDLRDFYRARVPSPPATLGGMSRRLPGDANAARNLRQFQIGSMGRADQMIRAVFSPGGACYDCHQVVAPPAGSMNYEIRPVAFPVRYMQHGWFDHKPHEQESCESCHKAGASSNATDLLLPDLASCRECHGGESSNADVPSSCAMCHDYHMDPNMPSQLIRQRVRGKKQENPLITASTVAGQKTASR